MSTHCGFIDPTTRRYCTRYGGHEDACSYEGVDPVLERTAEGWGGRPDAVVERAADRAGKTKTRAEIEAEKAAKPRPDLLPAFALSMVVHGPVGEMLSMLGDYFKTKHVDDLGPVLGAVLDELVVKNVAKSRADAVLLAGEIMGVGFRKHGPCTWRVAGTEQADPQCHYASLVRHLLEHAAGITADPDSGKHPLLHAVCQIAIMINLLDDPPSIDGKNDGRAMIGRPK